jgi:thiamine transporter ThiT
MWWPFWKWRPVEIFRCQESIWDIIIYLHMKCRWNRTMLNLCGILATILKMVIGRNFSMSGHHNLLTYEISLKSNNVEFVRYCAFWKWRPVEIFWCQESIRDIIIYLHMKCRWNRTMLNLCGIVVAILKMATGRNFSMSGHHYLPTYQILMISDNVEFLRPF